MKMMKNKNLFYIIIVMVFSILAVLLYAALANMGGTMAVISLDGEEYERIDLSRVEEAYEMEIKSSYGSNVVHVEPGRISITHASCPDKICVRQGAISGAGIPIVCLPNRLVVLIEGGALDG